MDFLDKIFEDLGRELGDPEAYEESQIGENYEVRYDE